MSEELLKERTDLSVDELKQLMDEETDVKRYKKLHFIKLKEEVIVEIVIIVDLTI